MKHGGKRPGAGRRKGTKNPNAGRKLGSLNRLTSRLDAEQRRTREPRPKMLMRVLNQRHIRTHQLTMHEFIRIVKEAAPYFAKPMGYVRVTGRLVDGRFVVDRGPGLDDLPTLAKGKGELD